MVENVARKVAFVTLALLVSLALIVVPDEPFKMGLDLSGGTRLVYEFDFDQAVRDGLISEQEAQDPTLVLGQIVSIVRNRVDPTGVLEANIRPLGTSRIVVELPGTPGGSQVGGSSTLAEDLDERSPLSLKLDGTSAEALADFPEGGGTIDIQGEKISYDRRDGDTLYTLKRGFRGTQARAHEAGQEVLLTSDDAIKDLIENLGDLSFYIQATEADFADLPDTDLRTEEEKLNTWVAANPGLALSNFNDVAPEDGGPHARLRWLAMAPNPEAETPRPELERALPLLNQSELADPEPDWFFTGSDVARAYATQDQMGLPAVGFEMRAGRRGDFGRFTGANEKRVMAIALNNQVESAPEIDERLPGRGIIRGRFSQSEVNDLVTVIRSGSLPIKPSLENEESVGPTLGQKYVDRGFQSALAGILAILAFMVFYYRRLGIFAAAALASNMLMLLGGLAFLRATITLPGIAGVILTVGMAVDANILIFDRIREELDKGQNVKQAAKAGFEKAFSAIFDANVTTLITALILYKVGTGPVRGFAVTLSIGIVASMISALVITRLLVHAALEKGVKAFPMGTWMVKAKYDFLSKAKVAVAVSAVAIVLGVGYFTIQPAKQKLGIDFLGGAEVQIRTEVAQNVDDVRALVATIPGDLGEAEVKPVIDSAEGDGYRSFRIAFKVGDASDDEDKTEGGLRAEVERYLASILQRGPVELSEPRSEGGLNAFDATLYFVEPHPASEVERMLTAAGLQDVSFTADAERAGVYVGSLRASSSLTPGALDSLISNAFNRVQDVDGVTFDLSLPIPSSSLVGAQVVGELRNKAVIALVVSLFAIVLYIRVRFAEYSYGFAAVAALTHDVLITLGALAVANALGIINGEISLPMVAAFLTIIGYSLNDTIVIFDRVRENLPRMKKPLNEVLNLSINQTLSRTILTSITTLIALVLLFVFNFGTGNTLEGFSFAMIIGVLTGTYSTIFIANPVLLWLEDRAASKGSGARAHLAAAPKKDDKAVAVS